MNKTTILKITSKLKFINGSHWWICFFFNFLLPVDFCRGSVGRWVGCQCFVEAQVWWYRCLVVLIQVTNCISISCVCPVIDHKFHHNIVKEAMEPQTILWQCYNEIHLSITGQMHEKHQVRYTLTNFKSNGPLQVLIHSIHYTHRMWEFWPTPSGL